MAPTVNGDDRSQMLETGHRRSHPEPGEEIVISGIAGNFPDSDNIFILRENLFNKVDLISNDDRRWKLSHPEIPQRTGKINNVEKFDASFFGVTSKQAHTMDPMGRMLLEKSFEAILDAGLNPNQLKGSRTGVFVGACFSESEKIWLYQNMQANGFGVTGCARGLWANRISYCFGCIGPSYCIDSACSSSLFAMEHAFRAISDGTCDSAIVGGCNLCLHPYVSLQFSRLGVLSPEGRCRSFDQSANGYARSEAVSAIFLQKAKNSRRAYAQMLYAKTNCDGYKEEGITYPAGNVQKMLLKEFYDECGVDPNSLEYVECHGTGTKVGDPEELVAMDEIFCNTRKVPLKIGTVKSNLGHSEAAAGVCSLVKMCISYDTGFIPPNLNYETPKKSIIPLIEGRMTVITEKTPWNRGMVGVSSFGFGGANVHVLLKNFYKEKVNKGIPRDNLPRLVCVSGRTESAVNRILVDIESRPIDSEFIVLLHRGFEEDIRGHLFRGYTLMKSHGESAKISREITHFSGAKRPIWFVFSGMGSQWTGMGTQLMRIPVFAAAIEKCHQALHPKGIDITRIITDPNPAMFDNVLRSFVGITAIQIGLCDILKEIGVVPDHIIGHSVGELGCAYADGCFTIEETILSAYSRGLASIETPFIKGSMAAVGMGYKDVKDLCPDDIQVACHNGPDSSTISGPADSMKAFVAHLQSQGIFAKEVPCSNIPYHSKYIAEAGPKLLKYLRQVIKSPCKRSPKWVSSSIPQHLWDDKLAQYSSAEYHTNNLLNPVLFEETSKLIHDNAITIEIAPHGLLQAILRRSLRKDCTNVPLTERDHPDNVEFLFTAIGKLYEVGVNPQLANLYPKVQFPVSSGTPMIAHLIEWEHSQDWYVTSAKVVEKMRSGERILETSIVDEDCEFLAGHVIDGRNLYPATGYLVMVWETFGMMLGKSFTGISVVFENIRFLRATNIPKEGPIKFTIMIQKGSGNFEITESNTSIVTGRIYRKKEVSLEFRPLPEPVESEGPYSRQLNSKDFYKEMKLRGYHYSGLFRGLQSCNAEGTQGMTSWINNWVTFMDTMLQLRIITIDSRNLFVPTRIEKLSIDAVKHYAIVSAIPDADVKYLPVTFYKDANVIRSGGVEARGVYASPINKRNPLGVPVLEKYLFVPNFPQEEIPMKDALRTNVQLVLENLQIFKVRSIELIDSATEVNSVPLLPIIKETLEDLPLIQPELLVISEEKLDLGPNITVENKKLAGETNTHIFVGSKLLERENVLKQVYNSLKDKAFVISRESASFDAENYYENVDIITAIKVEKETLVLFRKKNTATPSKFIHIKDSDDKFNWIDEIKAAFNENLKLVLVCQNEKLSGIIGLANCLRREPGGNVVKCIVIMDPNAPKFNPDLPFYEEQIDKELAMNVFQNGQWGSNRYLTLENFEKVPTEHAYADVTTRGDLSSLTWIQGDIVPNKEPNIVHVYYSALNFRDIMTATARLALDAVAKGRLHQECVQGLEFSGKTKNGTRVMGMVRSKATANVVRPDPILTWLVPDNWTLEEAATVPIVYSTVYYALIMSGKMKPGESILIHAGTGGVGQAAINVCLYYGCKIFTTVGTPEKRAYIKKMFPQLRDECIGCSRDTSFEEMVMRETNGEGVRLVLNSLADDKLQASIRCLAMGGRFLEIGKFDISNDTNIGMNFLLKVTSIHGILLDLLFDSSVSARQELKAYIYEGIKNGCVKPLPREVFEKDELEKSHRYMAAGKHVGKVLIKIRDEEPDKLAKPTIFPISSTPKYVCQPDNVYVVIGGLGGFGLELVDYLVLQGARKVVINSRRGITNGYQSMRIRTWINYEANIVVSTDDIKTQEGCINLLKSANSLGTVKAIFNLAVVLNDAIFENQTREKFKTAFGPKAIATQILDMESRKLCPDLEDFVVFSSIVAGRGNAGQCNYGMANSVMERICEERQKAGFPALAIEWGAVGEVGIVADMQEDHIEMEIGGTLQQRISSCLRVLDQFLKTKKYPVLSSMVVAEKKSRGFGCGSIIDTVATIMGIKDLKTISMQSSLAELGMDSMMAVEIKQSLEREYEIFLTAQDIRTLSFAKLLELTAKREAEASTTAVVKPLESLTGFKVLVRNVGDEQVAAEPIIHMNTKCSNGADGITGDSLPTLFMIPGLEGMASALESISKRLKCHIIVLQLGFNNPNESILNVAKRLSTIMRTHLIPGAPFMLFGYSYGAIIALALVKILEKHGHVGKLFCVDGAPEFLQKIVKANFITTNESILQDTLLTHMLELISPKTEIDLMSILSPIASWEEKIAFFLQYVPTDVKHSKTHQIAIAHVMLNRIKTVINYSSNKVQKFNSQIILLRTKENANGVVIEENYGLQNYSEQPVKVYSLEGNHVTILENKECANIINRSIVEKKIIFKNKAENKIINVLESRSA